MNPDSTKTDRETTLAGEACADASGDGDAPPLSAIFDALSDERSRRLLYRLADEPERTVPVDELAAAIAERESGESDATPDEAAVDLVRTTFHHRHLPKLADVSLVRYDESAGTVTLSVSPEALEPYLSLSRGADDA